MKQQAVSIRIGWVIEYKGKPWTVVKATHIKPGKGGAFMQVEMKSVEEGTKTNERFRSEDTVEKLMVEEKDCQFLYEDALGLTFMDSETFEQFVMPADILGDSRPFMVEGITKLLPAVCFYEIFYQDNSARSLENSLPLATENCRSRSSAPLPKPNRWSKDRPRLRPTNRRFWTTASASWFRRLSTRVKRSWSARPKPTMSKEPNNVVSFPNSHAFGRRRQKGNGVA